MYSFWKDLGYLGNNDYFFFSFDSFLINVDVVDDGVKNVRFVVINRVCDFNKLVFDSFKGNVF